MILRLLIVSFFITAANAQREVKDPIIIRNDGFKEGVTMSDALDEVYKRIIPKKSTKDPATCFWMLGDKKYLIVRAGFSTEELEIEPILITKLVEAEKGGAEYLINRADRVSENDLISTINVYSRLARANDVDPVVMVVRSESLLLENLKMLRLFRELGMKHIYISPPAKVVVAPPVVPLPKKRPASPHKK